MKRLTIYTIALAIVALGATSCGKKTQIEKEEIFQEADIEDGPTCGCESTAYKQWHYPRLVYVHIVHHE